MGRCFARRWYDWEAFDLRMGEWKSSDYLVPKGLVSHLRFNYRLLNSHLTCISAYSPPPTVTGAYSIHPVANGTYVNGTHFTLTFLCKGCILTDGSTFAASDTDGYLGWALSSMF